MTGPHTVLLSTEQAAEQLGISASRLRELRQAGRGPRFFLVGSQVGYGPMHLLAWSITYRGRLLSGTRASVQA